MTERYSVVIPAKNEASNLGNLLPKIKKVLPDAEIIVINDGSTDDTVDICNNHNVKIHSHPYSMGNGAAIKSGARIANGDIIIFMDADLQHNPDYIPKLIEKYNEGYDMVVGARDYNSQANMARGLANTIYNTMASIIVGKKINDLTSGFRIVNASKFREFLYVLPNGFSYPATITMAFFRAGYPVTYLPIKTTAATRKSHIRPLKDGVRFLLIIFRVGTLYSPLKLFVPISLVFFFTALLYYLYTFITVGRFTNMSGLLFTTSIVVFLIGLVSEQITILLYSYTNRKQK